MKRGMVMREENNTINLLVISIILTFLLAIGAYGVQLKDTKTELTMNNHDLNQKVSQEKRIEY